MKRELIKVKAGDKECFAEILKCDTDGCEELATVHLTQDGKFYCDKHGNKEVGNFIGAVAGLGGFA